MTYLARVSDGMDRHDDGMNNARPDGEPNEAQVADGVPCGEEEEDAESDVDTENHLQIRRLLRLQGPAARPEAVQHEYANDEDEAEDPEDWPQEGGGRRRVHRVLQCGCRQRWWLDARPNGVRLSCGAELKLSQTEDYLRERGAVSFRRVLGRRL